MQLTKRLQAVADFVSSGGRVADVGCDHAYISIYLAENKIARSVIALDINKGPLERAKANIEKYGLDRIIETRLSDGLQRLKPDEADSIVIAGMGGALMVKILSEGHKVMHAAKELILQPQSEIYKVREFIDRQQFTIIAENMVIDEGKYYFVMKAVDAAGCKEPQKYLLSKREHFHFGRLLLEKRHPVLKSYLLWELGICENILQALEKEDSSRTSDRRDEINERIGLIRCGLKYYS
ncbi:MAG: SAM-dependent methyltransferase [Clostridiales bacterium]|nr:SAM-dependent methyltransferase [Clostridiales bacterium]